MPMRESGRMDQNLKVSVDADTKATLERLARESDRSLAAEVRRALREYLTGHPGRKRKGT